MKRPRTLKILRLIIGASRSCLRNEPYTLGDSLEQLDDLGGVYIKFLQMVVLQMEPNAQRDFGAILSVYEHSKPDKLDIRQYLSRKQPNLLRHTTSIATEPFATGSFGQVYRAQLDNGENVVIKVLRPSVVKYLNFDLRLLGFLAFWVSLLDRQKLFNFRNIYREFRKTCKRETDYVREAGVALSYYRAFKDHPKLLIPYTYKNLSGKTVLVQQDVRGLSVADVLARQASHGDGPEYVRRQMGSDLHEQLYVVGYELLAKLLLGDVYHADPHPGNILLLPDNRVALIDFGMTAQVSEGRLSLYELLVEYEKYYSDKLEIDNFMMASLKLLAPDLFAALRNAESLLGGSEDTQLMEQVKRAAKAAADAEDVQPLITYCLERRMIMRVLLFAVNKQNRFGFTFDMQLAMTLKAVQTYLVLVLKFDDDSAVIRRVIGDVLVMARSHMDEIVDVRSKTYQPHEALEILSTWFDKVARNDPAFLQKLAGKYME